MNVLQTCKSKVLQNDLCPFCKSPETVPHFLLYCSHFNHQRENLVKILEENVLNFSSLAEKDKLQILLNIDTEKIRKNVSMTVHAILKYVRNTYQMRQDLPKN